MSSEEKKQSGGRRRQRKEQKKVVFQSWIKSRRNKRGKGPWKGIFRDPVKLC